MTDTGAAETILTGRFLDRPNRFVIHVELNDGEPVKAFCPNTSRLIGLLDEQPELLLETNHDPDRKTDYTVRCIKDRGHWVGIEAARANDLFEDYLRDDPVSPFSTWTEWEREVTYEESQFDFRGVERDGTIHWTEVKSLSSRGADNRSAFFSGTPSKRGWRHLGELESAVETGGNAHCVFVVQRSDVVQLAPGEPTHPVWIKAIRSAENGGVSLHGFRCEWTGHDWQIQAPIPVIV